METLAIIGAIFVFIILLIFFFTKKEKYQNYVDLHAKRVIYFD